MHWNFLQAHNAYMQRQHFHYTHKGTAALMQDRSIEIEKIADRQIQRPSRIYCQIRQRFL